VTILGGLLLAVGLAFAAIGLWSAAMGRRPSWLSAKTLRTDRARSWGAATALGGLGAALWGANLLFLNDRLYQWVALGLILAGAVWITLASPNTRRSR
jgi:threonine/homoserine efflux transporter RhtA